MTNVDQSEEVYPHERPGAVLIWPKPDPNMVYDAETKRVTDTKTGASFGSNNRGSGHPMVYTADIRNKNGETLYVYELKYGGKSVDGELALTIWQVFWAIRGDDYRGNIQDVQIPGREKGKNASLEHLGQFLRAKRRGLILEDKKRGMKIDEDNDKVVLVDRRRDDPIDIRKEKLF